MHTKQAYWKVKVIKIKYSAKRVSYKWNIYSTCNNNYCASYLYDKTKIWRNVNFIVKHPDDKRNKRCNKYSNCSRIYWNKNKRRNYYSQKKRYASSSRDRLFMNYAGMFSFGVVNYFMFFQKANCRGSYQCCNNK